MFGWFRSLFSKSAPELEPYDHYSPKQRHIYHYFDGEKTISADPVCLHNDLMEVWADLAHALEVSSVQHAGSKKAHEESVRLIRKVFGVKSLKEGGLTDLESKELLAHFFEYTGGLKKNSHQPPTSPGETSLPTNPTSAGKPPIPSTPVSSSTEPGPTEEGRGQS